MNVESFRFVAVSVSDCLNQLLRNCSLPQKLLLFAGSGSDSLGTRLHQNGFAHSLVNINESLLEALLEVGVSLVKLFLGDVFSTNQVVDVKGSDRALGFNQVVHHRLGHRWVIALVVSTPAVANDVDNNVLVELLAILES